jgi:hypothetical protein
MNMKFYPPLLLTVHDNLSSLPPVMLTVHDNLSSLPPLMLTVHDNLSSLPPLMLTVHDNLSSLPSFTGVRVANVKKKLFVLSYYVSLHSEFLGVMSITISAYNDVRFVFISSCL